MITVKNLVKTYSSKTSHFVALDNVSLTVKNGGTLAIVGKSGSGKSTLMHIMSGLDRPTNGTVTIDGVDLFSMKAKAMDAFRATKMSFIFQSFFIEANQTCYQNVMLPLEIAKLPRLKRKQLVLDALSAVELADKANNLASNLSGGQKQRLAIARAIVNQPTVLFADEPTGNLDSVTGDKIMELLLSLNRQLGCTVILVTHDRELAAQCAQQIQLKDGRVIS